MSIEFENADDIMRELNRKTVGEEIAEFQQEMRQQPGVIKSILATGQQYSVREILEHCLTEADETENIIVVRFSIKETPEHCETGNGTTMMCVQGRSGVIHALRILGQCREALGKQLADEFFREQMKDAMRDPDHALGQFFRDLLRSVRNDQDEPKI